MLSVKHLTVKSVIAQNQKINKRCCLLDQTPLKAATTSYSVRVQNVFSNTLAQETMKWFRKIEL